MDDEQQLYDNNQKQKTFCEVYEKTACNISIACRKTGIGRTTYYDWYNKTDEEGKPNIFRQKIDSIKAGLIDFAESALFKKISGTTVKDIKIKEILGRDGKVYSLKETHERQILPDTIAVMFFLKCKAGYRDSGEVPDGDTGDIPEDLQKKIQRLGPDELRDLIRINEKLNGTDDIT